MQLLFLSKMIWVKVLALILATLVIADAQGFGGMGGGAMGGGGGGMGGGGGGGFMRAFSQLSSDLTPQQREQVRAIMMDPTTPKYLMKQRMAAFYRSVGGNAEVCPSFESRRIIEEDWGTFQKLT